MIYLDYFLLHSFIHPFIYPFLSGSFPFVPVRCGECCKRRMRWWQTFGGASSATSQTPSRPTTTDRLTTEDCAARARLGRRRLQSPTHGERVTTLLHTRAQSSVDQTASPSSGLGNGHSQGAYRMKAADTHSDHTTCARRTDRVPSRRAHAYAHAHACM